MYVTIFDAYDPQQKVEKVETHRRSFNVLYAAFFKRMPTGGMTGEPPRPLIVIGNDPVRIEAAIALKHLLEDHVVEFGGGRQGHDPKGFDWHYDEEVMRLINEYLSAWAGTYIGGGDAESWVEVEAFFKATDEGPTRKFTGEEYKIYCTRSGEEDGKPEGS
jgi:hypothetical protein